MTRVAAEAIERHLASIEALAEPEDCYMLTASAEASLRERGESAA